MSARFALSSWLGSPRSSPWTTETSLPLQRFRARRRPRTFARGPRLARLPSGSRPPCDDRSATGRPRRSPRTGWTGRGTARPDCSRKSSTLPRPDRCCSETRRSRWRWSTHLRHWEPAGRAGHRGERLALFGDRHRGPRVDCPSFAVPAHREHSYLGGGRIVAGHAHRPYVLAVRERRADVDGASGPPAAPRVGVAPASRTLLLTGHATSAEVRPVGFGNVADTTA